MGEGDTQAEQSNPETDMALRAFDSHDTWFANHNEIMVNSGVLTIKSCLILNGGACLALLAFLANTWDTASADQAKESLHHLILGNLAIFAWGALLAVTGAGTSFLVNLFRAEAHRNEIKDWNYPYISETPAARRWSLAGDVFQWISIVVIAASPILFLVGLIRLTQQLA